MNYSYQEKIDQFIDLLFTQHFACKDPIQNTQALVKIANEAQLIPGEDYLNFKNLYDLTELALNKFVFGLKFPPEHQLNMLVLEDLQDLLPTETERSKDQSLYQQFSTPLPIAYLLTLLSNPSRNDRYLEPSAGTGSIATFIANAKPQLIALNELHPDRGSLLMSSNQYQYVYRENSMQIHNMKRFHEHRFNKIVMNPPFSRDINMLSKVDPLAGAKHIAAALKTLSPTGILCLLINHTFKPGSKAFRHLKKLVPDTKLIFNKALPKDTFSKKGTSFDTRIMVLSKNNAATIDQQLSTLNTDVINIINTL